MLSIQFSYDFVSVLIGFLFIDHRNEHPLGTRRDQGKLSLGNNAIIKILTVTEAGWTLELLR